MGRQAFDEMAGMPNGHAPEAVRSAYGPLKEWLDTSPPEFFDTRRSQAELFFRRIGITFAVYGDNESTERLIPFDIIPRVLTKPEWALPRARAEAARHRAQRLPERHLRRAGMHQGRHHPGRPRLPERPLPAGDDAASELPHDVYVHIAGIDIVRVDEDDLLRAGGQCPHPVRRLLHAGEPRGDDAPVPGAVLASHRVAPVENYPDALLATLRSVAPQTASRDPTRRAADARPLQLGVLRALVPGRQARGRAGRGVRPLRQGRRRLHAHDRRPAAGRRDLPPHRRRLPRSAGLPARIRCSACRG